MRGSSILTAGLLTRYQNRLFPLVACATKPTIPVVYVAG